MRKKKIALVSVLAAIMLVFGGCFVNVDLADSFDESAVIEKGKEFVTMLNEDDYEACAEWFSDTMKEEADAEDLHKIVQDKIGDPGAFESFTDISASGTSQDGKDYAICVVLAKYENKEKVQYNVTFDTDMKIAGFYCK